MRIKVGGALLHLGRPRNDGFRNIELVRLTNWRDLIQALFRAKIRSQMAGKQLYVQTEDTDQLKLNSGARPDEAPPYACAWGFFRAISIPKPATSS